MGCNSSGNKKHQKPPRSKDSLTTFPQAAQPEVAGNSKAALQLEEWPMAFYKMNDQAIGVDTHSLAKAAVDSVNALLRSSELVEKRDRHAMKAVKGRLEETEDNDENERLLAVRALLQLIEELSVTYPRIEEYVRTSYFSAQRPPNRVQQVAFETLDMDDTPSFDFNTPRNCLPDTPDEQALFLETPRMASAGLHPPIFSLQTPRSSSVDTPRFGREDFFDEPVCDEFFVEFELPALSIQLESKRNSGFCKCPTEL